MRYQHCMAHCTSHISYMLFLMCKAKLHKSSVCFLSACAHTDSCSPHGNVSIETGTRFSARVLIDKPSLISAQRKCMDQVSLSYFYTKAAQIRPVAATHGCCSFLLNIKYELQSFEGIFGFTLCCIFPFAHHSDKQPTHRHVYKDRWQRARSVQTVLCLMSWGG